MTLIAERTVLFADLRGSTSLFETLGNAEATSVITHTVTALARVIPVHGGRLVKTLGDGLMAIFDQPGFAIDAAGQMHETLAALVSRGNEHGASSGLRALRLQVGLARGEVVEMAGDCYGDAVNVAARLIDHAGDNETLVTAEVLQGLNSVVQGQFRRLDRLYLRGRAEPVQVHLLDSRRLPPGSGALETATTMYGEYAPSAEPEGIRLIWLDEHRMVPATSLPLILGRSPQATFCVDDSRVSRSHARIDWHGGNFQLTDLSYNGTYVRFAGDAEVVSLRRGSCTLHGHGVLGLGSPPSDPTAPLVQFEVMHLYETQPRPLASG